MMNLKKITRHLDKFIDRVHAQSETMIQCIQYVIQIIDCNHLRQELSIVVLNRVFTLSERKFQ